MYYIRIYDGRNNFKQTLKVIEETYTAIKELSNRLQGCYTVTRHVLERINSNLVESQISRVGDNCGYYEIKVDQLARRIDLLEINLNQYFINEVVHYI